MNLTIDIRMINSSGIGTYIHEILKRLVIDDLLNITLLSSNALATERYWLHKKNIKIINFESKIYTIKEQIRFLNLIPKNTDIFWSPHYNIPLAYPGKLLATVHDVFHLANPQFVDGYHKRIYAKMMFYALSRKADAIITVSNFSKNELLKYIDYEPNKVYPIHNGVDSRWFSVISERKCAKPYLLYVGNVKPHKNLTRLLQAYSLIIDKIPHDLIIVGKKEGFITGDTTVADIASRLQGRVQFTGYVTDEELQQYFVNSEALVFPSLYEGFGLPPLEAMACGCPVAVSDIPAVSEVCGDAAIFFNPLSITDMADKMVHITQDKSLRASMVQRGLARAKQFTWEKSVEETLNVLRGIL